MSNENESESMVKQQPINEPRPDEDVVAEVRFVVDARDIQRGTIDGNSDSMIMELPSNLPRTSRNWNRIFSDGLASGQRSDITIYMGTELEPLHVHSLILTLRCPKFQRRFKNLPLLSHAEPGLTLPNVNPKAFKNMIHYIYTGNLRNDLMTDFDLLDLWYLADEYGLPSLSDTTVRILRYQFQLHNIAKIYHKAVLCGNRNIELPAFTYMLNKAEVFLQDDGFLDLHVTHLAKLLENDKLKCKELEIFRAVIRWGTTEYLKRNKDNTEPVQPEVLREILIPVLPLIRFPIMTTLEISLDVAPTEILTENELLEIYVYISSPENMKPHLTHFNPNPRRLSSDVHVLQELSPIDERTESATNDESPSDDDASTYSNSLMEDFYGTDDNDSIFVVNTPPRPMYENKRQGWLQRGANSEPLPSTSRNAVRPKKLRFSDDTNTSSTKSKKKSRRRLKNYNAEDSDSDSSDDEMAMKRVSVRKDCVESSWNAYVSRWENTPKETRETTNSIILEGFEIINLCPIAYMPDLEEVDLDLEIGFEEEDEFLTFVKLFDIKRFIIFNKQHGKEWKLDELWDMGMSVSLIINGVTMMNMNREEQELTLSFRNDSDAIMSGLNKSDQVTKLNLVYTNIPTFDGFPTRCLEKVLLYYIYKSSPDVKVSDFIRKCPNLTEFSCWTALEQRDQYPIVDLTKDFISEDKLTHLALFKFVVTFVPKTVKGNLTELFLDCCAWSSNFENYIHTMFPMLRKVAIIFSTSDTRERWERETLVAPVTPVVTVRLLANLLRLHTIEWIRIWGLDWTERHTTNPFSPVKKLRTSVSPISDDEFVIVKSLLVSCDLREDAYNFLLEKDPESGEWTGVEFKLNEEKNYDPGYWELMERMEFEHYKLDNVYRNFQVYKENFIPMNAEEVIDIDPDSD